jgi:2-hydroxychromene-2-carboxylate isomerase
MKTLELWFDYSCPYAYLASTQAEALAERTGARLEWKPMLLGGVFAARATPQNLAGTLSPAKARHMAADQARWADLFGVPLVMPAEHPRRTVAALRATLARGCDPAVIHAFYRAYWVEGRAIEDEAVVRDIAGPVDLAAHKDDLRVRTEEAIALGIFGAPTFRVGDAIWWGQDRMHFVEEALSR